MDKIEEILTKRLCERNGWEYGSEDYDIAVADVKWFLSQPEISFKAGEKQGYETGFDDGQNYSFTANCTIQSIKDEARKAGVREVVELSDELLEIGRKAIEDVLVEWRDNRISEFTRGNGLVIREKDGRDSSIIRFGPETALKIGIKAIGHTIKQRTLERLVK